MKNRIYISLLFTCLFGLMSCEKGQGKVENKTTYQVDHSDPSKVLQAVFDVAAGADAAILGNLCDPKGQNDGDTRRICDLAGGFDQEDEFVHYFQHAKLKGEARTENGMAYVPFLFGPQGDRDEEMELIERDGKWYLMRF